MAPGVPYRGRNRYGARMRHLLSLLAGVIVAPLTWCLVALGQSGSQDQVGEWVSARRFDTVDLIEPAIYLAVAGILLGLIATLRISPVGPLVGGLLLIAAYVGMFITPLDMRRAVPDDWEVWDRHLPLTVPLDNGTLALIGVLLVMAVFSAERWRRRPAAVVVPGAPGLAGGPDSAAEPPTATEPGATAEPPTADLPAPEPVGDADALPDRSPEPEKVSVGAEASARSAGAASALKPTAESTSDAGTSGAGAEKAAATRTETPTESPWSAPPGQSRPEKS